MLKKKKVYLTKGRLKDLHTALSIDEVLYEKHRRMLEDFNRYTQQWARRKQVIGVIKKHKGFKEKLMIIEEIKSSEGILVIVK